MSSQFKGIQVTGTCKISLPPNVAYISGGVVTTNAKVGKAVKENTDKMVKVLAALKEAGVPGDAITTTSLQIQPQWQQAKPAKKAIINGYLARNGVTVKTRNMEKVGNIIDALSETANEIEGLFFAAEYPEKEQGALALAMNDAKARATKIAQAGGIELGQLVSCVESSHQIQGGVACAYIAQNDGGGMPVAQGDIDLTVIVTVVYAVSS